MNKRIEKLLEQVQVNEPIGRLAEQSGCTIDRLGYGEGNLEKFAELIVKECADIANEQFSAASGLDDRDCWTATEIKKRFGVEE